eukprot:scaffold26779_cov63-Phaeocystis_antarctica.AAC.2
MGRRACSSAARPARTLPPASPPVAAVTSLLVLHRSALLMTALRAMTRPPSAVATPTQRPPSSSMSSCATCVLRRTCEPLCLVTPRTSASTMACVPPLGKSSVTPGRVGLGWVGSGWVVEPHRATGVRADACVQGREEEGSLGLGSRARHEEEGSVRSRQAAHAISVVGASLGSVPCSRKQIMSSQLRMKGSVTPSSSRIFEKGSCSELPPASSTRPSAGA